MNRRLDLTTGMDLTGLALVAGGTGAGLWHWIGPFGLAMSGLIMLGGSWFATRGKGRS